MVPHRPEAVYLLAGERILRHADCPGPATREFHITFFKLSYQERAGWNHARIINRQPIVQAETNLHYNVRMVCRNPEEAHVRALLLQSTGSQLSLRRLDSNDLAESGRVEVTAQLTSPVKNDAILEQVVGRLSLEPTVSAASWSVGAILE